MKVHVSSWIVTPEVFEQMVVVELIAKLITDTVRALTPLLLPLGLAFSIISMLEPIPLDGMLPRPDFPTRCQGIGGEMPDPTSLFSTKEYLL